MQNAARAAFGRGEVAEAQVRWVEAYTHFKRAVALHETTDHLKSYAHMTWRLAKGDEAVAVNEKILALVKIEFGDQSPQYAAQLNNLAVVVKTQERYPEAEALFRDALAIGANTIGTAHPDYAIDLNNLGVNMYYQEKFPEARDLLEQALTIRKATLPADHPDIATNEENLAHVIAKIA